MIQFLARTSSTVLLAGAVSGQALYGIGNGLDDGSSNLFRIENLTTFPSVVDIGETGFIISDIAIHPRTGHLYGLVFPDNGPSELCRIDPATGFVLVIGSNGVRLNALEFTDLGFLYGWGSDDTDLYLLETVTGGAFPTGIDMQAFSGGDLAYCAADGFMYGTTGTALVRTDLLPGPATVQGNHGQINMFGLEVDENGVLFGFEGSLLFDFAQVHLINKASGAATRVGILSGGRDIGLFGVAFACENSAESSTALRNGSGVNPQAFTVNSPPVINSSWSTSVDLVTSGALASIVVVALGGPTSGTMMTGDITGELLCLPPFVRFDVAFGEHELFIRGDCNLLGRTFACQAATVFPGNFTLTNAIDVQVGFY